MKKIKNCKFPQKENKQKFNITMLCWRIIKRLLSINCEFSKRELKRNIKIKLLCLCVVYDVYLVVDFIACVCVESVPCSCSAWQSKNNFIEFLTFFPFKKKLDPVSVSSNRNRIGATGYMVWFKYKIVLNKC